MKTEVLSFVCPQCATTLRMKNRALVDRTFSCPECDTALQIISNDLHKLQIVPFVSSAGLASVNNITTTATTDTSESGFKLSQFLQSPITIAWSIASVVIIITVVVIWQRKDPTPTIPTSVVTTIEQPTTPEETPVTKPIPPNVKPVEKPTPPKVPVIAIRPQPIVTVIEPVIAVIPNHDFPVTQPPVVPVAIDISGKLKQRLIKFEQLTPIPLEQFIIQFEELAGFPIQIDSKVKTAITSSMKRTITINMQEGSLQDLLNKTLAKTNLSYKIEPTHLLILNKTKP